MKDIKTIEDAVAHLNESLPSHDNLMQQQHGEGWQLKKLAKHVRHRVDELMGSIKDGHYWTGRELLELMNATERYVSALKGGSPLSESWVAALNLAQRAPVDLPPPETYDVSDVVRYATLVRVLLDAKPGEAEQHIQSLERFGNPLKGKVKSYLASVEDQQARGVNDNLRKIFSKGKGKPAAADPDKTPVQSSPPARKGADLDKTPAGLSPEAQRALDLSKKRSADDDLDKTPIGIPSKLKEVRTIEDAVAHLSEGIFSRKKKKRPQAMASYEKLMQQQYGEDWQLKKTKQGLLDQIKDWEFMKKKAQGHPFWIGKAFLNLKGKVSLFLAALRGKSPLLQEVLRMDEMGGRELGQMAIASRFQGGDKFPKPEEYDLEELDRYVSMAYALLDMKGRQAKRLASQVEKLGKSLEGRVSAYLKSVSSLQRSSFADNLSSNAADYFQKKKEREAMLKQIRADREKNQGKPAARHQRRPDPRQGGKPRYNPPDPNDPDLAHRKRRRKPPVDDDDTTAVVVPK